MIDTTITEKNIINYLEGCQFILDIYFNNFILNYNWVYENEKSPSLTQISEFLSTKTDLELSEIFRYDKNDNTLENKKYLNRQTYKDFSTLNREGLYRKILSHILTIMKPNEIRRLELDRLMIIKQNNPVENIDKLIQETQKTSNIVELIKSRNLSTNDIRDYYLDYDYATHIFDCTGKQYFNKCLESYIQNIPVELMKEIEVNGDELKYKQKYLKYKQKYLELKKEKN
jgi:hypothetical protein